MNSLAESNFDIGPATRILLIEADGTTEELLTRSAASDSFAIVMERHDLRSGCPGEGFDWSRYDAVLLAYDVGQNAETGLDWLGRLQGRRGVPPVIMLSSVNSAAIAVQAMKLGAQDYLLKSEMTPARLRNAVASAVLEGSLGLPSFAADSVQTERLVELVSQSAPQGSEQTERLVELVSQPVAMGSEQTERLGELTSPPPASEGPSRDAFEHTNVPLFSSGYSDVSADPEIRVPGYRVVRKIGAGGMSTVWLGERLEDDLQVVLKVLFTDANMDRGILGRFMQEYELIGRLRNRNVVEVYERGFARAYAYIAMEHLPGGDLTARIRQGLRTEVAIDYLNQMANGLAAAHGLKIVHRDLKPRNVLFRDDGSLAITDFGVAKMMHEIGWQTQSNAMVGTPFYMSPEQCDGAPVDARSDLYSLGIILFEMLTGERPFRASSLAGLFHAHRNEPTPQLPGDLARFQPLVDGLLAKDPDERFQDVEDLFQGLKWVI